MDDGRDRGGVVPRLRGGGSALATWCSLDSAAAVEAVAVAGVEVVLLDLEHGEFTPASLPALLRAVEVAGATGLVRVGWRGQLGAALDAGAAGVLVPDVRSVEEARAAVRACAYAPDGERGAAPMTRDLRYGMRSIAEHVQTAAPLVGLQIEGEEALEALDRILALPGLDLVFLGAQDLAVRYGFPGALDHPRLFEVGAQVAERARAHGVATGVWAPDLATAKRWRTAGIGLVSVSNVTALLVEAARGLVDGWDAGGREG